MKVIKHAFAYLLIVSLSETGIGCSNPIFRSGRKRTEASFSYIESSRPARATQLKTNKKIKQAKTFRSDKIHYI